MLMIVTQDPTKRVLERSGYYFTTRHCTIMRDLLRLATSHYSEVRMNAQSILDACFSLFPYSYKLVLDDVLELLKPEPSITHEEFKDACRVGDGGPDLQQSMGLDVGRLCKFTGCGIMSTPSRVSRRQRITNLDAGRGAACTHSGSMSTKHGVIRGGGSSDSSGDPVHGGVPCRQGGMNVDTKQSTISAGVRCVRGSGSDILEARRSVADSREYLTDTAVRLLMMRCSDEIFNPHRYLCAEFHSILFLREEFMNQSAAGYVNRLELSSKVQELLITCVQRDYEHIYIPILDVTRDHFCLLYVKACSDLLTFYYIDSICSAAVISSGGDTGYYDNSVRCFVEPLRRVFAEIYERKHRAIRTRVVCGSALLHLATQKDGCSCGVYVVEYARRLFELEMDCDPLSQLRPICESPVNLRKQLLRRFDGLSGPVAPAATFESSGCGYSKSREQELMKMALLEAVKRQKGLPVNASTTCQNDSLIDNVSSTNGAAEVKEYAATGKKQKIKKKGVRCREKDNLKKNRKRSGQESVDNIPQHVEKFGFAAVKNKKMVGLRQKENLKKSRKNNAVSQFPGREGGLDRSGRGNPNITFAECRKEGLPVGDRAGRTGFRGNKESLAQLENTNEVHNVEQDVGRGNGRKKALRSRKNVRANIAPESSSLDNPDVRNAANMRDTETADDGTESPPVPLSLQEDIGSEKVQVSSISPNLKSDNAERLKRKMRCLAKERRKKSARRRLHFEEEGTGESCVSVNITKSASRRDLVEPQGEDEDSVLTSGCAQLGLTVSRAEDDDSGISSASKRNGLVASRRLIFEKKCGDCPRYACLICHQLQFRGSVCLVKSDDSRIERYGFPHSLLGDEHYICKSCAGFIRKGQVPKLSASRIRLKPVPTALKTLGRLERTLIALRIPFMTIRSLPRGGQVSLKGNFVNIPVALETSIASIPRHLSRTETVVVKLKRKKQYKSNYIHEAVRADAVLNAAKFLIANSPLYAEEGVSLFPEWTTSLMEAEAADEYAAFEGFHEDDVASVLARHPFLQAIDGANAFSPEIRNSDLSTTCGNQNAPTTLPETSADDSGDDWEEEQAETDAQIPPAETLVDNLDLSGKPCWDITVAPGEGHFPCSVFADKNTMAKAFPTVFGGEAMPDLAALNISWPQFSKWLLGHIDRSVALNVEAIFFLLKVGQIKQLCSAVQVAMRRGNAKGKIAVSQLLSAQGLESFVNNDDGYRVLTQIRGSPSYWRGVQKEIFAMVRQLGKPTFFLSFSAAETRWPTLIQSLVSTVDHRSISAEEAIGLPWETKCRLIRSDPDTCVRYFDSRFRAFASVFLKMGRKGPVGVVEDYVYRVEFQQRGSPHIHSLWWIAGAPVSGFDDEEEIAAFVDNHITCSISDDSVPVALQVHRHSKTCKRFKGGRRICRFGFPKPPMSRTMILHPFDSQEDSMLHAENWLKVEAFLNTLWKEPRTLEFDDFLRELDLSEDQYVTAVRSSLQRTEIFLKRSTAEIRVNGYNLELLRNWQANMDIQFVINAYAAAKYIVSYMLKSQRGISNTMKAVVKEVQGGNVSLWSKLGKVSNTFLNSVEISEQEAVWMIRQLPLYRCSRDVFFVNACPLSDRVVLLKPVKQLQKLNEEDANSTDVECDNVIKRYQRRPAAMELMSLATFATWYDCVSGDRLSRHESDDIEQLEVQAGDELLDDALLDAPADVDFHSCDDIGPHAVPFEDKLLRRRLRSKILRSPRIWEKRDKEKHFFEKLMLYQPWRDEEHDLCVGTFGSLERKWFDAVQRNPQIFLEIQRYDKMGSVLDTVIEEVRNEQADDDQQPPVAGNVQHLEEIDEANYAEHRGDCETYGHNVDSLADVGLYATSESMDLRNRLCEEADYKDLISSLNPEQKQLFYEIIYKVKFGDDPLRLFVTGGAGVGKSYLLKAVYQYLTRFYRKLAFSGNPDAETVLKISPTGKAAHLISGYTAHNVLRIPVNQSLRNYTTLDPDKMNTIRHDLGNIKVLIIDEISMIGYNLFRYIDQRLRDVMDIHSMTFGGLHVVCFGDLFQLRPVKDNYVFQTSSSSYDMLADSLWREFCAFELTTIMRQREDLEYALTLNRLREGLQTEDDISRLLKRSVSDSDVHDILTRGTVCLCRTNDRADTLNQCRLDTISGLKRTFEAIDKTDNTQECYSLNTNMDARFTGGLATTLTVAIGMRVELTINIDTADGLTNGAGGVVKGFSKKIPQLYWSQDIVWILFDEGIVGTKRRQRMRFAYRSLVEVCSAAATECPASNWTPIVREVRPVSISRRLSIDRQQMPIRLAAAKTIHRSQGDSYSNVLADFSAARRAPTMHHSHYVAFSRVRSIAGLWTLNLDPKKISVDPSVKDEVARLRSTTGCHLRLSLPALHGWSDKVIVYFHNVTSLRSNFACVKTEPCLKHCHLLFFAECRLSLADQQNYMMEGFRPPELFSSKPTRYGLAVYVSPSLGRYDLLRFGEDDLSVDVVVLRINATVLVGVYRSPSSDMSLLISALHSAIERFAALRSDVVVLGDFNVDINGPESRMLHDSMCRLGLHQLPTEATTEAGTTIDKIYVNHITSHGFLLQSYYSFHSPLVAVVPRSD